MIVLHSPLALDFQAASMILTTALLIAPISNDPTNPINIVVAIAFALCVLVLSWLRERILAGTKRKIGKGMREKRSGVEMTREKTHTQTHTSTHAGARTCVADQVRDDNIMEEDEEQESEEEDASFEDGDFSSEVIQGEWVAASVRTSTTTSTPAITAPTSLSLTTASSLTLTTASSLLSFFFTIPTKFSSCCLFLLNFSRKIPLTLIGLALSLFALLSFIFQSRTTYWLSHSLWHIAVMSSAYPFIKGRDTFVKEVSSYISN